MKNRAILIGIGCLILLILLSMFLKFLKSQIFWILLSALLVIGVLYVLKSRKE